MAYEDPMEKEYGPHEFPDGWNGDYTVDCIHKCGYSAGPSRSSGAVPGDNLMSTACPGNPANDVKLGGDKDKLAVLAQAARGYSSKVYSAEQAANVANERLGQGPILIANHRDKLVGEVTRLNQALEAIGSSAAVRGDTTPPPPPEEE